MNEDPITIKYYTTGSGEKPIVRSVSAGEYCSLLFKVVENLRSSQPEKFDPATAENHFALENQWDVIKFCTPDHKGFSQNIHLLAGRPFAYAAADWIAIMIMGEQTGRRWFFGRKEGAEYKPFEIPALLNIDWDGSIKGDEILFPQKRRPWPLPLFDLRKYEPLGRLWHLLARGNDNPLTWSFRKDEANANILAGRLERIEESLCRVLGVPAGQR